MNQPQQMDPAHLDVLAQQQGFPDYATYAAWSAQRNKNMGGTATQQGPTVSPEQTNFLQQLLGNVTPFALINRVTDRYKKATGQK